MHSYACNRELDSGSFICAVSSSGRFTPVGLHQQRYEHRQWCHTGILLSPHIDAIKQYYATQQLQRQRGSEAAQITTAQTSYRRLLRHRNMLHLAALASIHSAGTTASTTASTAASRAAAANDSSTDDDNEGSNDVSSDVAQLQTDEDAQALAEAAEAAGVQPVLTLLQHYSEHTAAQRHGMRSLARLASTSRSALLQVYSAGGVAAAVHALRLFQQPEAASGSGARLVCVDFAAAETASACQESACWLLALLSQEALAARAVHAAGGCAALCSVIQTCLK
jgi:hypothetical protein